MDAKTQDAAGAHATHQPPCPFAGTLRTYDWRERGCCCIEPATPRETALAAPTGETDSNLTLLSNVLTARIEEAGARGRTVNVKLTVGTAKMMRDSIDNARRPLHVASRLSAPSEEQDFEFNPVGFVEGWCVMNCVKLDDSEARFAEQIALAVHTLYVKRLAQGRGAAVRSDEIPAPSAPQEPRVEPSEGMER